MLSTFVENISFIAANLRIQDLVDMCLVWLVVYRILVLIRRSGAVQVISGLGILAIAYIVSIWAELFTFNWLLERFFGNLFVIVVILFQVEIRRALAHIGSNPFWSGVSEIEETHVVEEIAKAVVQMAQKGHGGLIVVEKDIELDYFVEVGTGLDSTITSELLVSIFHPQSPLHDGAVIVRGARAHWAGCFLPLSKNPALDKNLGTRHRAAIGLAEETDALVIVVSEESHSVGIVLGGRLQVNMKLADIRMSLYEHYGITIKSERVKK